MSPASSLVLELRHMVPTPEEIESRAGLGGQACTALCGRESPTRGYGAEGRAFTMGFSTSVGTNGRRAWLCSPPPRVPGCWNVK